MENKQIKGTLMDNYSSYFIQFEKDINSISKENDGQHVYKSNTATQKAAVKEPEAFNKLLK